MHITVQFDNLSEMYQFCRDIGATGSLTAGTPVVPSPTTPPQASKPPKPAKADKQAAPAETPAPAAKPATVGEDTPAPPVTLEVIKARVQARIKDGLAPGEVKTLLGKFGAASLSQNEPLAAEHFPEFLKELEVEK